MEVKNTNIKGCYIINLDLFGDHRGGFVETFNGIRYKNLGLPFEYVQDNMSYSVGEKVFRGLHYQKGEHSQGKLVSCSEGEVADYIVDVRKGSPTYLQTERIILSKENQVQVYVPEGCLHGFEVLKAPVTFNYKVTRPYNKEADAGVLCTDPDIKLPLPDLNELILSEKDQNLPLLKDSLIDFDYKPRCFVTGVSGQLGPDIVLELQKRGYRDIYAVNRDVIDLTDYEAVEEAILRFEPDVIFHAAAYTDVDGAQRNQELAYDVNVNATDTIVEAAKKINAKVVYISTDYVFDGTKEGIYEVDDIPNPMSVYGKTKYEGEKIVRNYDKGFIVRTSWVFGGLNTKNFVRTMINLSNNLNEVSVVDDQIGSPTYTKDLAKILVDMSETEKYGIYHANNEGYCTWNRFAFEIFNYLNKEMRVTGVTTDDYYGTKAMQDKIKKILGLNEDEELTSELISKVIATRPLNSMLSKQSLDDNGFDRLRHWSEATEEYVLKLKLNEMENR